MNIDFKAMSFEVFYFLHFKQTSLSPL